MSSILFLVNHPEVYVNHRNYFEEKGFEVTMRKLDPYKGNIREIKSYLTKKLIELESTQRSTLTGIELMKSFKL